MDNSLVLRVKSPKVDGKEIFSLKNILNNDIFDKSIDMLYFLINVIHNLHINYKNIYI